MGLLVTRPSLEIVIVWEVELGAGAAAEHIIGTPIILAFLGFS